MRSARSSLARRYGWNRSNAINRFYFPAPATRFGVRPLPCRLRLHRARSGRRSCACSSASGSTDAFTAIVAAGETRESKPSPDPYVKAVALLAAAGRAPLNASDCVAIEDSRWGLASAQAAGLRTVAVTQTYDARELPPVDLVIPDLAALDMSILNRLATT